MSSSEQGTTNGEAKVESKVPSGHFAGISAPVDFSTPNEKGNIKEKGIFITGGASGIGAAIAKALAQQGGYVTVADLSVENGTKFAEDCQKEGLNVQFAQCDVTSYQSQLAAFKLAVPYAPSKTLSHVFANAGVPGHFMTIPSADKFDPEADPAEPRLGSIQIGLIGAYYSAYLATHYLRNTPGDRSITITGSMSAYTPLPYRGDYCAAKAGARVLMKTMRPIHKDLKMRVNLLVPNFVLTPMTADRADEITKRGYHFSSMDDVVTAAERLVSDENVYGRAISIDRRGICDIKDDHEELDRPIFKFAKAAG
ncbi:MAG: hypothetical protein M1828_004296 [Chrysothrix sp. TS-e1954]|nr:MAG: hypothetical protein M1828_004296 [Chrysothrix sp. TS-e1954]